MQEVETEYYDLRSGFLHLKKKVTIDKAVKLTADEEERLKKEITASPAMKLEKLKDFWNFVTKTKGEKPIDFTAWLDRHCGDVRRQKGGRK